MSFCWPLDVVYVTHTHTLKIKTVKKHEYTTLCTQRYTAYINQHIKTHFAGSLCRYKANNKSESIMLSNYVV